MDLRVINKIIKHRIFCKYSEIFFIIISIILFLGISYYEIYDVIPWEDEVMYLDPVANLYFNGNYSSNAWAFQKSDEFWACNVPLYSLPLYYWIKIFDFGLVQARMFNIVMVAFSALLFWLFSKYSNLIKSSFRRVILFVSLLCSDSIIFISICGRYDSIALLLLTFFLYIVTINNKYKRLLLFLIGLLLPIGGLQLVAMYAIIGLITFLVFKKQYLHEFILVSSGLLIGFISLFAFYLSKGVLSTFIYSTFGSQHTISGQFGQLVIQNDQAGLARYTDFFRMFVADQTLAVLIIISIFFFLLSLKDKIIYSHKATLFFLFSGLFIPIGMFILGKFPIYYTWMAVIPLLIFIFSDRVYMVLQNLNIFIKISIYVAIVIMIIMMSSYRNLFSIENWSRSHLRETEIEYFNKYFNDDDWVYSDYKYYYKLKPRVDMLFTPNYTGSQLLPSYPEDEKRRINKLFIKKDDLDETLNKIGGVWTSTLISYDNYLIYERE